MSGNFTSPRGLWKILKCFFFVVVVLFLYLFFSANNLSALDFAF